MRLKVLQQQSSHAWLPGWHWVWTVPPGWHWEWTVPPKWVPNVARRWLPSLAAAVAHLRQLRWTVL